MSTREYQVGDWFETNGYRWARDKTGCWNGPGDLYVTDGHIEEFNLTVTPAPVVPTIVIAKGRAMRYGGCETVIKFDSDIYGRNDVAVTVVRTEDVAFEGKWSECSGNPDAIHPDRHVIVLKRKGGTE